MRNANWIAKARPWHDSGHLLGLLLILTASILFAVPAHALQTSVRASSFTYDTSTGLLLSETVEPNNSTLAVTTGYTYDSYGNKQTVAVAPGASVPTALICVTGGTTRTSYNVYSPGGATKQRGRYPLINN